MRFSSVCIGLLLSSIVVGACSGSTDAPSNTTVDPAAHDGGAGNDTDATPSPSKDAPDADPGPVAPDAGDGDDAGPVDPSAVTIHEILGTFQGHCGAVRALLTSPSPALITDHIVFVAGETYERSAFSPDGQKMYDTPNAGGSSEESELMSFEILHYCEGASLLKTETQVTYDTTKPGAMTDILVEMDKKKVGVSVTRSYKPADQTYTDDMVQALLEKKLKGVNESSARVMPADKWVKQILHVFTANPDATAAVERVYPKVTADLRADTIVLVTETKGGGFVYCHPSPPLGSECP